MSTSGRDDTGVEHKLTRRLQFVTLDINAETSKTAQQAFDQSPSAKGIKANFWVGPALYRYVARVYSGDLGLLPESEG